MLKSLVVSLVVILLSVFSTHDAYGKEKGKAFIRFVCFEKSAIDSLVEADKVSRYKALLTFKILAQLNACIVDTTGRIVTIERKIEEYMDSEDKKTVVIIIKNNQGKEFYTIIQEPDRVSNKDLLV